LSYVNDRLKEFLGSLFDPKFYKPCNEKNIHFITHYFSEV